MEAAALPAEAGFQLEYQPTIEEFEDLDVGIELPASADLLLDENPNNIFGPWAHKQYLDKYSWKDEAGEPTEVWPDTAYRVVRYELGALGYTDRDWEFQRLVQLITERKLIPGGRKLAQAGRPKHQTNNCFLYRCGDSREAWFEDLLRKCGMSLSTGGGVGVVYSDVRPYGTRLHSTGGFATGPLTPANMVNDAARRIMGGGHRRSAIWAGLHWWHPDIFDWIVEKDWPDYIKEMKKKAAEEGKDQDVMAPLDMTNISVILDTEFFEAYDDPGHDRHDLAHEVYWKATAHMVKHGEPGFSIDCGENEGENLRNACTEITSRDDSDVCNLGSINLARVESIEEFEEIVNLSTLLLLAGTVYSDIPHAEVKFTREKNRRLGLGLMGLHEWMLHRGLRYEMSPELRSWLEVYATSTEKACAWADKHNLSHPIKTRAIAPTGTIGILGETTTGIEPLFCVAYKRRFLDTDGVWKYQFVIDPIAQRLIDEGIDPDSIETAYSLSYDVERRIKFQAELQEYVDHSMASTINLPYAMTDEQEVKDFGETLYRYVHRLRGVTCYPDGTRSGQPLEAVPYDYAKTRTGVTYDDNRDHACASGVCGI
jgi:ribonucleoside-diphosphate reductase alpha chain